MHGTDKRWQLIVLIFILMSILAWVLIAKNDTRSKKMALEKNVEAHVASMLADHNPDDFDVITEVIAEKSLVLMGNIWGVIRIYIREKDDTSMQSFFGLECFYDFEDDQWVQQDSASIVLPDHIIEAYKTFEAMNYEVSAEAYEKF